jgi:hypothetical protein
MGEDGPSVFRLGFSRGVVLPSREWPWDSEEKLTRPG